MFSISDVLSTKSSRPTSSKASSHRSSSVYSGRANASFVVPPALSFDNVMDGKTCPPVNERDFLNFTKYVDFTPENLLFFMWHRDYTKRFEDKQGTSDIALAPVWTPEMQETAIQAAIQTTQARLVTKGAIATETSEMFKNTDFEKPIKNPFSTPPRTPAESVGPAPSNPWEFPFHKSENGSSQISGTSSTTYNAMAAETFQQNGCLAPFSVQPFREEINRIVATFLRDGSPRQLNLSSKERTATLKALEYTTHPSAFAAIQSTIESTLRQETHKRFIRHALCNGNEARIYFARFLGILTIVLGFLAAILLTLSSAPRGYRALAAIGWVIGTATLIAGMKGMCVVLHGLHHRHLRPWELFEDPTDEAELRSSFETFESKTSLEDYPWVIRYRKRNLVRKIFDREVWIQEPAIRQIQDMIFLKSMGLAIVLAVVLCCVFVPLPHGKFY